MYTFISFVSDILFFIPPGHFGMEVCKVNAEMQTDHSPQEYTP